MTDSLVVQLTDWVPLAKFVKQIWDLIELIVCYEYWMIFVIFK